MAAARKMDELLVSWLGSDAVYENVMELIENIRGAANNKVASAEQPQSEQPTADEPQPVEQADYHTTDDHHAMDDDGGDSQSSPRGVIPPFYPPPPHGQLRRRRRTPPRQLDSWEPLSEADKLDLLLKSSTANEQGGQDDEADRNAVCVRDQVKAVYTEVGQDPPLTSPSVDNESGDEFATDPTDDLEVLNRKYMVPESFVRITKDICRFPSFFNTCLYQRILDLWNNHASNNNNSSDADLLDQQDPTDPSSSSTTTSNNNNNNIAMMEVITYEMFAWYWKTEMEPYDASDRFFRLVKQPHADSIGRDDFLPFIKALLCDHPGLEFLSSHAEFQEKYAVTVITRIFYSVNKCHSGRITGRQLRRSDLLSAFHQVDEEEDINKVTRYLSYEHFYVLYCRFWELDHDRDYRITREDLLKYGDHSLSHMIVDRIFDAAPRPFEVENPNRDYLTYESFIYFMLSEEDKSNEVSVRYWFACVDVDGDGKLNNMEMRSFYAVQLHRMQCMGHEIVPFEDMLCQMMDMIKPANNDFFVVEDFLQPECCQVSGALFDALFNLNKYLLFEQRDPFVERQKREDEFDCDWDRFACIDYNRLAMEEEAREEEAMEIDWVTVEDDENGGSGSDGEGGYTNNSGASSSSQSPESVGAASEAPF